MLRKIATLTALTLGCAGFASANIIAPGATNTPDALNPNGVQLAQTTGTIVALNPNTGNTQYTVNYTVGVYKDFSNPLCSGCLDFYYQFTNNGPGVNERFSAYDFGGFITDVGYNMTSAGQTPISVDRSAGTGDVVGFNYTGGDTLLAGSKTAILLIDTNATAYIPGTFTVQDGVSVTGIGYAPSSTVTPEPASLALFGTGLFGVVGMARRRFNV